MDKHMQTINTIRMLSADMVQVANSGHPGAPMGMAPMAYAVWMHTMRHDPAAPQWRDRDRFVLSNGHASALLYSLLHLSGYPMPMEEIKRFRQYQSITPGHPEHGLTPGVETTTGPLGQGFANAVGFAMAETMLAAHFNRPDFPIVDHKTYVLAGDGCMMEGITSEAASLAGTLALNKLVVLYDDNEISIEGSTDLAFREDVPKRFESYGWRVLHVEDANDYQLVLNALKLAENSDKPTLIVCPTIIGYGSAAKQGTASAHGEPLGSDNLLAAKQALGMTEEHFSISQDVYAHVKERMSKGQQAHKEWQELFAAYVEKYPQLAKEWEVWHQELNQQELLDTKELWQHKGASEATRSSSGNMIAELSALVPNLVGGSADLAPSNKSSIPEGGSYSANNRGGRVLHFGVREHAMAAVSNGMVLHGGLKVFCATFFVFTDYMKGAMRLSAIMEQPLIYVLTHDSIGVGEDGATHQPVEHLAALRATPNMRVVRPCDARETTAAWIAALTLKGPTCLVLTRQNLPQYEQTGEGLLRGGYVLSPASKQQHDLVLMASGSEVQLVMDAQKQLEQEGIACSVVSMPCMELFLKQDQSYQDSVLPPQARRRLAVEAGATMPWYRFVGLEGRVIGLDSFGASAPAEELFEAFHFTVDNVVDTAKELMKG